MENNKLTSDQYKKLYEYFQRYYSDYFLNLYHGIDRLKDLCLIEELEIHEILKWFRDNRIFFVDIRPIDSWDWWDCEILGKDIMSPFFVMRKFGENDIEFSSYDEAEKFAIEFILDNL